MKNTTLRRGALLALAAAFTISTHAPAAEKKAAAGKAATGKAAPAETAKKKVYLCTPCGDAHDSTEFAEPGSCPVCGMPLVEKAEPAKPDAAKPDAAPGKTKAPAPSKDKTPPATPAAR